MEKELTRPGDLIMFVYTLIHSWIYFSFSSTYSSDVSGPYDVPGKMLASQRKHDGGFHQVEVRGLRKDSKE